MSKYILKSTGPIEHGFEVTLSEEEFKSLEDWKKIFYQKKYEKPVEKITYSEDETHALVLKAWHDGYAASDSLKDGRKVAHQMPDHFWNQNKKTTI